MTIRSVQLPAARPSFGAGAALQGRRRAPAAVAPRRGRLRRSPFPGNRCGVGGTFFTRRPEDRAREAGDGMQMATCRRQATQLIVIRQEGTHMTRLAKIAGTATAIAALLFVATSSEAQVNRKQPAQATKLTAVAKTTPTQDTTKPHRLILQVNSNDPAMMNLALNNATNVVAAYPRKSYRLQIDPTFSSPSSRAQIRDMHRPVPTTHRLLL